MKKTRKTYPRAVIHRFIHESGLVVWRFWLIPVDASPVLVGADHRWVDALERAEQCVRDARSKR